MGQVAKQAGGFGTPSALAGRCAEGEQAPIGDREQMTREPFSSSSRESVSYCASGRPGRRAYIACRVRDRLRKLAEIITTATDA
jgi:hypothetical protein